VSYQSLVSTIDPKSTDYLPQMMVETYGKFAESQRVEASNY